MKTPLPPITLEDFNLEAVERRLCVEALGLAGNIVGAAKILGVADGVEARHLLLRHDTPSCAHRPWAASHYGVIVHATNACSKAKARAREPRRSIAVVVR